MILVHRRGQLHIPRCTCSLNLGIAAGCCRTLTKKRDLMSIDAIDATGLCFHCLSDRYKTRALARFAPPSLETCCGLLCIGQRLHLSGDLGPFQRLALRLLCPSVQYGGSSPGRGCRIELVYETDRASNLTDTYGVSGDSRSTGTKSSFLFPHRTFFAVFIN